MSRAAWYEAPSTNISPPSRRVRPPAVESIAGWSARHRKTAVFGWLALVAVAYLIGQLLGSPSLQQNDLGQAVNNQINSDLGKATETSLPLTLILLIGVFGTLVAAGIPVLLALTSALTATWLLAIPGHWLPVGSETSTVVLLVGMAVGIDYSL